MSTGLFSIGITGMQAAQLGLLTTEHNVANASTPGYNRQRIQQATNIPLMTGAGAVGQGVHVTTIERMYNEFLSGQVNTSQTSVSELDSYYAQIKQIDNMLADPNSGLSPALQDFFKGVQQVAANPSSVPSRQSMLSSANALVSRIHGIEGRLSQMAEGVNSQITATVGTINSYAQQIANLNERIVQAQSASNQPANDLLDQRDQLVSELNKLIKVTTTTESNGAYNVFIGTGQQLVVGVQATTMTATASNADLSRIVVGLQTAGGAQELPDYLITGGQLGGLVRFRNDALDPALNEIGRTAASLALTFNAQHSLGQDLTGQAATNTKFFSMQNVQPTTIKNATNTGTGVLQAGFVSPPPIGGSYTLSNAAGVYTLTRLSDGKTWTGGSPSGVVDGSGNPPSASEGLNLAGATVAPGLTATLTSTTIPANFYTNLTASDYKLVRDASGSYSLTRLSDNYNWSIPVDATTPPNPDSATLLAISRTEGFTLSVSSGTIQPGDSFLIQPTRLAARNIAVNSGVAADTRLIAAAAPITTLSATGNIGKMTLSQGSVATGYTAPSPALAITATATQLTGFPAGVNVTAVYADGSTVASSAAVNLVNGTSLLVGFSFNGMSFDVSGAPMIGDSFTIQRNAGGVDDGRNIFLLGKLQTQSTMSGRTTSYQGAYAQFVSSIGNKTRETEVTGEAQQALLDQASNAREALSGVNLDEEAANLLRYQQAYQAAAKMLEIGNKLLDTVLSIRS